MGRLFILFVLTILFNTTYAQTEKDIVIGKRIQIKSAILNSDREISVYLPNSYNDNNYVNYPVLYLLDGRKFFNSFSGVITQLSGDASPQVPEMIVVGITSQDRIKDSSPTNSLIGYTKEKEKGLEVSGGAHNFLKFIQEELIPFIENTYRTNSYRTFVGYSFTGLPVVQALFSIPEVFNSYLVIDFSAWWDNEIMIHRLKEFSKEYKGPERDIFFTTVDRVSNKVYPELYNPVWTFIQEFEQNPPENVSFHYKKYGYKEENHHSMPLISFIDGIKYLFRGYMVNYDEMYTDPNVIEEKFAKLSQRLGYNVYLPEGLVNYYGYVFLYTRPDIEKSIFYFTYNVKNYPKSSRAWGSLAEAYKVNGNTEKAREAYTRALELNPGNTKIKSKLEALKN